MKKLPLIEKVYEAWTALTDGRIQIHFEDSSKEKGYADVSSSDGQKSYVVKFSGLFYSSDDNATFWRGYPGYPVIAVMMLRGEVPYDENEAKLWGGVNWTETNKAFKNNYAVAVTSIAEQRGIDLEKSKEKAIEVMEALEKLPYEIKRKI